MRNTKKRPSFSQKAHSTAPAEHELLEAVLSLLENHHPSGYGINWKRMILEAILQHKRFPFCDRCSSRRCVNCPFRKR